MLFGPKGAEMPVITFSHAKWKHISSTDKLGSLPTIQFVTYLCLGGDTNDHRWMSAIVIIVARCGHKRTADDALENNLKVGGFVAT